MPIFKFIVLLASLPGTASAMSRTQDGLVTVRFLSFTGKDCEYRKDSGSARLYLDVYSSTRGEGCVGCQGLKSEGELKSGKLVIPISSLPESDANKRISLRFYALHSSTRAYHYTTEDYLTQSFASALSDSEPTIKELDTYHFTDAAVRPKKIKSPCKLRVEFQRTKKPGVVSSEEANESEAGGTESAR